jgi:hypothetical protein
VAPPAPLPLDWPQPEVTMARANAGKSAIVKLLSFIARFLRGT